MNPSERAGASGVAGGDVRADAATIAPVFARAAVIGTGLIGGSVAAALRARGLAAMIRGHAPGQDAVRALQLGLVDTVCADPADAVDGADLVVLAAPIPAMPALFEAIRDRVGADALVVDCASTKQSTIAAAKAAGGHAFERFVPSHPIAGGERHGPDAARADLFEGRVAIVCPVAGTDPALADRARALWAALGAQVVDMDPAAHDAVFAEVSHWPHAVAFALCGAIAAGPNADPALRFAGAGLRDTTRIGASSGSLWADILLDNRDAVLACADAFERELHAVTEALRSGDRATLVQRFAAASRWRGRLG